VEYIAPIFRDEEQDKKKHQQKQAESWSGFLLGFVSDLLSFTIQKTEIFIL
jgi:hypothetical protein